MPCGSGAPLEPDASNAAALAELRNRLEAAQRLVAERDASLARLRAELDGIHRMRWWKLASLYWSVRARLRRRSDGSGDRETTGPAAEVTTGTDAGASARPDAPSVEDRGAAKLAERFVRYRRPGRDRFFLALARHLAPYAETAVVDMYFEFAITTNERGQEVLRLMERFGSVAGMASLDVGCAYGGFVVAFSRAGARATGIDVDPDLLGLGRLNLEDEGVAAALVEGDATRPEAAERFRRQFDRVTCNDVIEHVEYPAALVRFISSVLRPGGLAYLEIPNRNHPPFVLRDGHFQLFGIVLLERPEAARYYSAVNPGRPYRVGHYLEIDAYRDLFAAAGLETTVLPETFAGVSLDATLDSAREIREALSRRLPDVPAGSRDVAEAAVLGYLQRLESAPRTTPEERERFVLVYGPSFWKILLTRSE